MKYFSILLLAVLVGCTTPAKLDAVAVKFSHQLGKPSKPFSAFSNYQLKPAILSEDVKNNPGNTADLVVLEKILTQKLTRLFAGWSSSGSQIRSGTLIVQPKIIKIRIVGPFTRIVVGSLAGQSSIVIDLMLTDSSTGGVIANPRIKKNSGAWAGGWSFGLSDRNLHEYVAHTARQYFINNYR